MGNIVSFKIGNSNNSTLPPQNAGQIIFDKGTSSILVDVDDENRQIFSRLGGWAANKIMGTDNVGQVCARNLTFNGKHIPTSGKVSHYVKCYSPANDIIKYIDDPGIDLEDGAELTLELVNGNTNDGLGLMIGNSFPLGIYFNGDYDSMTHLPAGTVLHLIYKNFNGIIEPRAVTDKEIETYFNIRFDQGLLYDSATWDLQTDGGSIIGNVTFNNVRVDESIYPRAEGNAPETALEYQALFDLNLDYFDENKCYFSENANTNLSGRVTDIINDNKKICRFYVDIIEYDTTYTISIFIVAVKKDYAINGFIALNGLSTVTGNNTILESNNTSYLNQLIAIHDEFSFDTGYDLLGIHANNSDTQTLTEIPSSLSGTENLLGIKYNNGKLYTNEVCADKMTIYGYCTNAIENHSPVIYLTAGTPGSTTKHSFQMRFDVNATSEDYPNTTLVWSRATTYNWQVKRANNTAATASLTINGFSNPSDKTIKENFEYLNLDSVFDALEPVTYNFIGDSKKNIGFVAQDVEKAFNDNGLVGADYGVLQMPTEENGLYGLNYSQIIALNTDQIQKLKKRVRKLEDQLNDLTVRMLIEESKGG